MNDLVNKFIENKFDFELRTNLKFDEIEYEKLLDLLKLTYKLISNSENLSKELAFNLYYIPYVVRNTLDFLNCESDYTELRDRVEEAWIEIDHLVQACLGGVEI